MLLNEKGYTSFQIKPSIKVKYDGRRCMFRNDAFSLENVTHISAVGTLGGMNYFDFNVELERYDQENKILTYQFPTKSDALRAQRELCRAWTATEEFAYEELKPDTKES
jgi:hypothetical protein